MTRCIAHSSNDFEWKNHKVWWDYHVVNPDVKTCFALPDYTHLSHSLVDYPRTLWALHMASMNGKLGDSSRIQPANKCIPTCRNQFPLALEHASSERPRCQGPRLTHSIGRGSASDAFRLGSLNGSQIWLLIKSVIALHNRHSQEISRPLWV